PGRRRSAANHSPIIHSATESGISLRKQILEDDLGIGGRTAGEECSQINRIDINTDLPVARAGAVAGVVAERGTALLESASRNQVINLTAGVVTRIRQGVLDRRVVLVQNPKRQIHAGDGVVNIPIEDSVPRSDHGLVVAEGVPRERSTGGKVVPGSA